MVQLPLARRQSFLELTNTTERLQQEVSLLQRSIARLDRDQPSGRVATLFDTDKWKRIFSRN